MNISIGGINSTYHDGCKEEESSCEVLAKAHPATK